MTTTIKLSNDELLLARAASIEAADSADRARRKKLWAIQESLTSDELERITVEARLRAMRKVEDREREFGRDASSSYDVYKRQAMDAIITERYLKKEDNHESDR